MILRPFDLTLHHLTAKLKELLLGFLFFALKGSAAWTGLKVLMVLLSGVVVLVVLDGVGNCGV